MFPFDSQSNDWLVLNADGHEWIEIQLVPALKRFILTSCRKNRTSGWKIQTVVQNLLFYEKKKKMYAWPLTVRNYLKKI